nr:hypothetical protein CFP56_09517 [Quercus suber]
MSAHRDMVTVSAHVNTRAGGWMEVTRATFFCYSRLLLLGWKRTRSPPVRIRPGSITLFDFLTSRPSTTSHGSAGNAYHRDSPRRLHRVYQAQQQGTEAGRPCHTCHWAARCLKGGETAAWDGRIVGELLTSPESRAHIHPSDRLVRIIAPEALQIHVPTYGGDEQILQR